MAEKETDPIAKIDSKLGEYEADLSEKLSELKEEYREVIILKYVNELSTGEMAEILDKSKGNIRVLSFRAMEALRKIINTEENTNE